MELGLKKKIRIFDHFKRWVIPMMKTFWVSTFKSMICETRTLDLAKFECFPQFENAGKNRILSCWFGCLELDIVIELPFGY